MAREKVRRAREGSRLLHRIFYILVFVFKFFINTYFPKKKLQNVDSYLSVIDVDVKLTRLNVSVPAVWRGALRLETHVKVT